MSTTLSIRIAMDGIREEVIRGSQYADLRRSGPGSMGRMSCSVGDDVLLRRFVRETSATLTRRLRRFIARHDYTDEYLNISVAVPAGAPADASATLQAGLEAALIAGVAARWYAIAAPAEAAASGDFADAQLTECERLLCFRAAPTRNN